MFKAKELRDNHLDQDQDLLLWEDQEVVSHQLQSCKEEHKLQDIKPSSNQIMIDQASLSDHLKATTVGLLILGDKVSRITKVVISNKNQVEWLKSELLVSLL